jgi:hypothetical protein
VYTGLFSPLQVGVATVGQPSGSQRFVAETHGPDGACRVAVLTLLATWRVSAEQTACSLFFHVHSFSIVHVGLCFGWVNSFAAFNGWLRLQRYEKLVSFQRKRRKKVVTKKQFSKILS